VPQPLSQSINRYATRAFGSFIKHLWIVKIEMGKRTYAGRSRSRSRSRSTKRSKKSYEDFSAPKLFKPMSAALGNTQRVKMIYADYLALNPSVGGLTGKVYAANGLFDPDITGVGHQPSGFDQYKEIYERLTVIASRIRVVATPENQSGSERTGFTWGISFLTTKNTITNDSREYIENGETKWTKSGYGESKPTSLISYANLNRQLGMNVWDRAEFDNTPSSNPQATNFWHVWMQADADADIGTVYFTVEIDYDVFMRKNALLAIS